MGVTSFAFVPAAILFLRMGLALAVADLQSLAVGDLVALELYIPVSTHALLVNSVVR